MQIFLNCKRRFKSFLEFYMKNLKILNIPQPEEFFDLIR